MQTNDNKVTGTAATTTTDTTGTNAAPMQSTENPYRRADEVTDARVSTDESYTDEALVSNPNPANHDELEDDTSVNKGTDTFEEGVVETEHVNDDDNPARQPDRRDQKGNAFDDNINENNVVEDGPDSDGITEHNRYANINNAQSRTLSVDEKDH
ncbi:hypothetical protein [Psychrobacter aestuarii]|uniref:Uncharacterized protein n=1 Tax=Psychrobacter aestuarii TaxID=556327 RepID=A0ABN0VLS9_9GAMM|nr:hypothetical protein [Psychrobacter aestuarii]